MSQNPPEQQPDKKPDPWGRNTNKPQQPPDLDALLRDLKNKLVKAFGGKPGSNPSDSGSQGGSNGDAVKPNLLVSIVVIALLVLWVLSGIFIVSPAERSVITRFGRYSETVGPGPHWIPQLIESRQNVNVQRVSNFTDTYTILTQDENIISVSVAVQYRIDDTKDFLFSVVDPLDSLRQATTSAVRQVVGHNTLDDLLTTGRTLAREQVVTQLQKILANYKTGLLVTDVTLQSVKPPDEVTAAFDDAIKAREDQQAYINIADAYSNQVLATVQGKVARVLQEAEAAKKEVVLQAQGETAGYLALLPEYKAAPQVTRERLYLSTMESVFSQSSKVFLGQKNGSPMVYLPLDKMLSAGTTATAPVTATSTADTSALVAAASNRAAGINAGASTPASTDSGSNILTNRPDYPTRGGNQ